MLNRLTAIGMGVSAGLLVVVGLIAFPLFYRQAQSNIEAHYRNNLDRAEEQLRFRVSALLESLDQLAANSFVVNSFVDSSGRGLYLMPTLRDYRPPFGVPQALDLFDSNLSLFGRSGPPLPMTAAHRDAVRAALQQGRSQLIFVKADARWLLLIAVPVYYPPASAHEGVLLSRVDVQALFKHATDFLRPSECMTVSVGGQRLLSTACDAGSVPHHASTTIALTERAGDTVRIGVTFADREASALGSLSSIAAVYAAGSLVALALVYAATRYIGRPFAAKLEELAHTANALADDPSSTARVRWEHADEIGRLTHAFDTLIEKWRDIQSSLERRVDQRTEQLAGALQQAQEANRAKSEFLAVMSHEIRTPMNGVVGMIQALQTTELNDEQRRQLQVVRGSSDLLLRIIDDVLDFSRIDAGKLALEAAPFVVDRVMRDLFETLEPAAAANGVTLHMRATPPELSHKVSGDETRLRQVLTNLIHNAIKFTRPGGRVELSSTAEIRAHVLVAELVVIDTGIGIAASKLEAIFDPFEQADRSTTRRYGGTGLGLAIVKRLVDLMGGTVEVHSKLGQGSRFTIRLTLPLVAEISAADDPPGEVSSFKHLRVLIAEDNVTNQMVAAAQLHSLGIDRITLVDGGRGAVAAATAEPFDLILMDIQMPEMDGFEATAMLRQAGITAPIVAMTANVMEEDRLNYAKAGMVACLPKPMDLLRLREVIEHFIEVAVDGPIG